MDDAGHEAQYGEDNVEHQVKVASLGQQHTDGRHQNGKEKLHYEEHQLLARVAWIGDYNRWHGDKLPVWGDEMNQTTTRQRDQIRGDKTGALHTDTPKERR